MAGSIKKGDRGPDVERWQTILLGEGFDPSGVDGVFGNGTARATREFQRAHGLTPDAIVGSKTWAAAEAAIAEPEPLERGSRGPDVEKWQRLLTSMGFDPNGIDGVFGQGCERATKQFQAANGQPADGRVTSSTWSLAMNSDITVASTEQASATADPRLLKDRLDVSQIALEPTDRIAGRDAGAIRAWNRYGGLLTMLARELTIDPNAAAAVLAIESGGTGMTALGPTIRFENHIFFDRWATPSPTAFDDHFTFDPTRRWQGHKWRNSPTDEWRICHRGGQSDEWNVLGLARSLDETAAIESTSIGLAQIMGFNHRRIGYESPRQMLDAFSSSEGAQILGFFDFVATSSGNRLVSAIRSNDWHTFATGYNGAGKAARYAAKMSAAYDQLSAAR